MRALVGAFFLLFVLVMLSLFLGPATRVDFWLDLSSLKKSIFEIWTFHSDIVELRFVHILLSATVGFALATTGRCLQHFLQNPLADPHVVGLSAGSTAAVLMTILFAPSVAQYVWNGWIPMIWISAFAGSFFAFLLLRMLLFRFAKHWGASGLVLLGVFLNAGISALLMVIFARLSPAGLSQVQAWTLGSIQPYPFSQACLLVPLIVGPALFLIASERQLLLLSFGHDFAMTHGVSVEKLRTRILLCVMVISSACVCAAGSIGFVGLLVPHLTRRWMMKSTSTWFRPAFNGIMGACVLLCADLLSRNLTSPTELPVGVYAALLSVPFLLFLFWRERRP